MDLCSSDFGSAPHHLSIDIDATHNCLVFTLRQPPSSSHHPTTPFPSTAWFEQRLFEINKDHSTDQVCSSNRHRIPTCPIFLVLPPLEASVANVHNELFAQSKHVIPRKCDTRVRLHTGASACAPWAMHETRDIFNVAHTSNQEVCKVRKRPQDPYHCIYDTCERVWCPKSCVF